MKRLLKIIICWLQKLIRHIMSTNALLSCHFTVEWGGTRIGFMEVSGLEIQYDIVEQRVGATPDYSSEKMPGLPRYSNIVLKRGIIPGDNEFYNWIKTIKLNTVEKRDVTIQLLDGDHQSARVWKVKNAFPVKLTGPVLNAFTSEIAIETLELANEGISIID